MLSKKSLIGIIGSGAMGSGIAQVAASAGHQVFVYDNNEAALTNSKSTLQATLGKLVEKQKVSKDAADEILNHIKYVSNYGDFKSCDLIIEAIVENLGIKQKLFSGLETIISDDCILATNTSS